MSKRVGRPGSEDVVTEAAKQAIDADKIPTSQASEDMNEANTILKQFSKNQLFEAAAINAKRAVKLARAELEEVEEDTAPKQPRSGFNLQGLSPDDLKKIASELPEEERANFYREALGMTQNNPIMKAFMNRNQPSPTPPGAPGQPMSFSDMLQGMMAMTTMQIQVSQQKAEEWRAQQDYEDKKWHARMDEMRELMGQPQQSNPEVEALKVHLDFYKDALKEQQALLKEIAAKKEDNGSSPLNDKVLELQREVFAEREKAAQEREKLRDAEIQALAKRLEDAGRYSGNVKELLNGLQAQGVNARIGDAGDTQIMNEHEFKMKQLEYQEDQKKSELAARQAEAEARKAEAVKQTEMIKTIVTTVGSVIVSDHAKKDLKDSSPAVKNIAGGVS